MSPHEYQAAMQREMSTEEQNRQQLQGGLVRRAEAKPVDAARILNQLRVRTFEKAFNVEYDDALQLLKAALDAEYTRGRVDGAADFAARQGWAVEVSVP